MSKFFLLMQFSLKGQSRFENTAESKTVLDSSRLVLTSEKVWSEGQGFGTQYQRKLLVGEVTVGFDGKSIKKLPR